MIEICICLGIGFVSMSVLSIWALKEWSDTIDKWGESLKEIDCLKAQMAKGKRD